MTAFEAALAVHHGVKSAIRLLQRSLSVRADGVYGPNTAGAVFKYGWRDGLVERYLKAREEYIRGIVRENPDQIVFMTGWMNRLKELRREVVFQNGRPR